MTSSDASGSVRRRLDWLALLPEFASREPVVVAIGDVDTRERRVLSEHFGVDHVERLAGTVADVLVASGVDVADVPSVLATLSPEGVAIVLTPRPIPKSVVSGAVDAAGGAIRVLSCHAVVPSLAKPRRFVPVDHREAIRWYLRRLYIASGPLPRFGRAVAARVSRLAAWRMRARAYVVGGSAAGSGRADAVPAESPLVGVDDVIVTTSGHDPGSRTVLLAFAPAATAPTKVVKVANGHEVSAMTSAEQRVLHELQEELPAALRSTVPQPLGSYDWRGRAVSTESAFDGPTLERVVREAGADAVTERWLRRLEDWTVELATASAEWIEWGPSAHDDWIAPLVSATSQMVRASDGFESFTARLNAASARLNGSRLPIVRRHFDLGPWNVVASDDGIGVIDWEMGGHRGLDGRGLPLCDLDYFGKYWLHSLAGSASLADELDLFAWFAPAGEEDPWARERSAVRRAVERSATRLGIDGGFVPILVASNWMENAVHAAERTAVAGPTTTGDKASAYLARIVAELRFNTADA